MSNEVSRSDVKDFLTQGATRAGFSVFAELAGDALTDASDAKTKTDALMAALIGIALCANTIKDYGWAEPDQMVDRLIADMFGA
jgi:hypothetical protein